MSTPADWQAIKDAATEADKCLIPSYEPAVAKFILSRAPDMAAKLLRIAAFAVKCQEAELECLALAETKDFDAQRRLHSAEVYGFVARELLAILGEW